MKDEIMNIQNAPTLPLLELDLLKTLVAIAETGNFSLAAERVFRTPSAISMQVKKIEEILGRPVFVRDSRSVTLTADGEILLTHARRLLALNREVMAKFITPDITGDVRLGAVDHMAEHFLPDVLKRFAETHPGVAVDVTIENSKELACRVSKGQLDLAMVTCATTDYCGLPVEVLCKEKLVWAGLKGGVAIEQNPLPISVWEDGCVWRMAALNSLEKANRDYKVTFKSAYVSGQKAALKADLAVAPLPVAACEGDVIVLGPEAGLPDLGYYSIGAIKAGEVTKPVEAVIDHLRSSFANF